MPDSSFKKKERITHFSKCSLTIHRCCCRTTTTTTTLPPPLLSSTSSWSLVYSSQSLLHARPFLHCSSNGYTLCWSHIHLSFRSLFSFILFSLSRPSTLSHSSILFWSSLPPNAFLFPPMLPRRIAGRLAILSIVPHSLDHRASSWHQRLRFCVRSLEACHWLLHVTQFQPNLFTLIPTREGSHPSILWQEPVKATVSWTVSHAWKRPSADYFFSLVFEIFFNFKSGKFSPHPPHASQPSTSLLPPRSEQWWVKFSPPDFCKVYNFALWRCVNSQLLKLPVQMPQNTFPSSNYEWMTFCREYFSYILICASFCQVSDLFINSFCTHSPVFAHQIVKMHIYCDPNTTKSSISAHNVNKTKIFWNSV